MTKQKKHPTSVRLDSRARQALDYLTRSTGFTQSQVLSAALVRLHRDFLTQAVDELGVMKGGK